jgi:hypothetical protein
MAHEPGYVLMSTARPLFIGSCIALFILCYHGVDFHRASVICLAGYVSSLAVLTRLELFLDIRNNKRRNP